MLSGYIHGKYEWAKLRLYRYHHSHFPVQMINLSMKATRPYSEDLGSLDQRYPYIDLSGIIPGICHICHWRLPTNKSNKSESCEQLFTALCHLEGEALTGVWLHVAHLGRWGPLGVDVWDLPLPANTLRYLVEITLR